MVAAQRRPELRGPAEFVVADDPFVGHIRPAPVQQVVRDLPGLAVGHVRGDVALLAPHGIVDPVLGQVEVAVEEGVPLGRGVGQEDAELTVLLLAQPAAPLAGHPATVGALFGEGAGVEHEHAVRSRQLLTDVPPQFGHDLLVVPNAAADEEFEVLAWDAGLGGDRLDGLPREPAEEPANEGAGVPALFFAVEQRQIALQEARDVVTAAADVGGRDFGVGEQGLSLGVIQ